MRYVKDIFRSHAVLNADGKHVNGCDKESNHHYGDAYEEIFTGGRHATQLMLEVGVAGGASMLGWMEVFPNATIVGMDIEPSAVQKQPRIEFWLGDQTKKEDCERAANGRLFDVIVEDAMHTLENTLLTLFWLWPFVKPDGLYIVEEWANIGACRENIRKLFPNAKIVDTIGPFGGVEPLVVLRKK